MLFNNTLNSAALFLVRYFYILKWHFGDLSIDMGVIWGSWFLHNHKSPHPNQWGSMKNHKKYFHNRMLCRYFDVYPIQIRWVFQSPTLKKRPWCDKFHRKKWYSRFQLLPLPCQIFSYLLCLQHQDRWNFWHIQVFWELCFSDTWSSHKNLCCGIKVSFLIVVFCIKEVYLQNLFLIIKW